MTRILVIEDEPILRNEVIEWLTLQGYEANGAEDGTIGVKYALRDLPDLVLCDVMMPHLDGYGVLLELRSNPVTASIPFIFTTAKVATEDIRYGMNAGADDYITKPFARLDLLKAIETRLQKKAALEQTYQDITTQLQSALNQEHEQRLLKAKMVAMFSHDFRNPLTTIMSSIGLLRDYADRMDEQRRRTHLNRAEASVRQLLQMLDEMLFLAQTDSESFSVIAESINIGQYVEHFVAEFQAMNNETHHLVFESSSNNNLWCDPRLLRQIVTNLISNAIKYSPKGGEVRVTLDIGEESYDLKFKDQGIGIPESDQPRLFSTFQRGSNVSGLQGTGLGLAIVKQAVALMAGSIALETQVGVGTTITVHIPIRRGGNEAGANLSD